METMYFIVQLLNATAQKSIKGRIHLQKLVYFCKAFGVDIDANYKLYIYGPFSQQVANALQECVIDDIMVETNGEIRMGTDFKTYWDDNINEENKFKKQTTDIVNKVLGLCGNLTAKEIEIDATTFYIQRQQIALYGKAEKDSVIEKVEAAKGARFTHTEILDAYERVQKKYIPLIHTIKS